MSTNPPPYSGSKEPPPLPPRELAPGKGAVGNREGAAEVRELLTRLIQEESALYALTRDWRYNAESRRFIRLHALLDEQFTEIGERLARLAWQSRDFGGGNSMAHGERASTARSGAGEREAPIVRELLGKHEAMLAALRAGEKQIVAHIGPQKIAALLAEMIGHHEKDAFMLRALLWEVENPPA